MMNEWIISSSILIIAVLLGRLVLRGKISLRLQYALWGVVLLRLLMPVQLFSHDLSAGTVAQQVDMAEPVRQVYVSANENRYEQEYDEAYRQVVAQYEAAQKDYDPIVVEHEAREMAQGAIELDITRLLYGLWLTGMGVMAAVIIGCNIHFILRLRRRRWELPIADCLLPVFVTEAVPTPCIFGFFRPAIYLTPEAVRDDTVRGHVLQHELTHYRHLDHIWSVLRSVCLVLHWYNPLVWIAAKVSRADGELACDEGAMKRLGESQRGDYGRTLIGLTCSAPVRELFLTATTMTGSAGSIRERIKLLMKRPKNTVLTLTAVILLVTLAVGCTFAGAPETTAPLETAPSAGEKPTIPAETGFSSNDTDLLDDPEAQIRELFGANGSGWHLAALQCLFASPDGIDVQTFFSAAVGDPTQTGSNWEPVRLTEETMAEALEIGLGIDLWLVDLTGLGFDPETGEYQVTDNVHGLQLPTISEIRLITDTEAQMLYSLSDQRYCATLLKGENWKVYSNQLLLEKPLNARALTDAEQEQVRAAFAPYNCPLSCFVLGMYDDISEMSQSTFLSYYPTGEYGKATEEEFLLLKAKYPEDFENMESLKDMPWPITPIRGEEVRALMEKYTLVSWDDLPQAGFLHYLEETDSYYTYYSDVGLFGFSCTGGWVYDGGATLFDRNSALILTEQNGTYYIQAHIPAMAAE